MTRPRRTRRVSAAATAATALTAVLLAGAATPASAATSATQARRLAGTASTWLGHAKDLGRAPSGRRVTFGVLLRMHDRAGADRTLRAVSTPGRGSYGHWLSPARYRARFAPTAAEVRGVRRWLGAAGFHVTGTYPSGSYVTATGTIARLDATFGVDLHLYHYGIADLRGTTRDLTLPAATPASVDTVVDVGQTPPYVSAATTLPGPVPGSRPAPPCSRYEGQRVATDQPPAYGRHQPYRVCGHTGQELRSAYGLAGLARRGYTGRGVTVAVTGAFASPTLERDVARYNRHFGLPAYRPGQFRQVLPSSYDDVESCGGTAGPYTEETLDLEAVHAMAPGARVRYVGGRDCGSGLYDAWARTIDGHRADVVTNSWLLGTEDVGSERIAFFDRFALEAALTGISDDFPTGDGGDETSFTGKRQVSLPASDPYVTAVGGTSLGVSQHGDRTFEYGWQGADAKLEHGRWSPRPPGEAGSGGGGGTSRLFAQPGYQRGRVPAAISRYFGGAPHRALPDVSLVGDPVTGFYVGETQRFPDGIRWSLNEIGGTSLASPLLAGVDAILSQYAGGPVGFANPVYYARLGRPGVHDVRTPAHPVARVVPRYVNGVDDAKGRTYELTTFDVQDTTLHTRRGYDDLTGVGSIDGAALAHYLRAARTGGS